jgi:hypothetical protein
MRGAKILRDRAADALNEDGDAVLEALRTGVREGSPASRAQAAVSWVQLVYGRQLQAPKDEQAPAALELSPQERSRLIAELAAVEPELAPQLGIET